MARRIIFPIIIFLTLLAAANVRSVPLFVLAIAEIIFAGFMIALALFQRSRLTAEPVRSFVHLRKGDTYDCRIKVDNLSPFPVSRFRVDLTHGYLPDAKQQVSLYGGTDKNEGFLRIDLDNKYCGLNRVELKNIKCYDFLLLSAFSKKADSSVQIAVLPDKALKMRILYDPQPAITNVSDQATEQTAVANGGTEPEDIRPYRQGDPVKHIYWKQSAKMNELWVREFREEAEPLPVVKAYCPSLSETGLEKYDTFVRILYALLSGVSDISERFIFRRSFPDGAYEDYLISDTEHIISVLVCLYREDFRALNELYVNEDITPAFELAADTHTLALSRDGQVIKTFEGDVSDAEINDTVIYIYN